MTVEERRAYQAAYREKNRDKIRAYAKAYYWSHPDHKKKSNECSKDWYDSNRERAMARQKAYIKANKDEIRERSKNWKSTDIRYNLFSSSKSRAKRFKLPFDITINDIVIPDCCPILGYKFSKERDPNRLLNPSLDRIIPEKGYVKGNISVISLKANMLKNDMNLETARKIVQYLEERVKPF